MVYVVQAVFGHLRSAELILDADPRPSFYEKLTVQASSFFLFLLLPLFFPSPPPPDTATSSSSDHCCDVTCIILVSVSVSLKACQSVMMSNQQFELKVGVVYKNNPFHNVVVLRLVAGSLIYYTLAAPYSHSLFGTYEIFWVWAYSSLNPIILFYVLACLNLSAPEFYI